MSALATVRVTVTVAVERRPDGRDIALARVTTWEPGERLVFVDRRHTEVEVVFESVPEGTRVVLEHRGLDRLPPVDADEVVIQAEIMVGDQELWLGGKAARYWAEHGGKPDQWIGVWVDDVDAQYERVRAAGVECEAPVGRDYDVRSFNVYDPEGYLWGFLTRLGTGYVQTVPTEDGGLREILADRS